MIVVEVGGQVVIGSVLHSSPGIAALVEAVDEMVVILVFLFPTLFVPLGSEAVVQWVLSITLAPSVQASPLDATVFELRRAARLLLPSRSLLFDSRSEMQTAELVQ
jgi:hypothetical protein